MVRKKGVSGIVGTMKQTAKTEFCSVRCGVVTGAKGSSRRLFAQAMWKTDFAPENVRRLGVGHPALMTRQEFAQSARMNLRSTSIPERVPAERHLAELLQDGTHCKKRIVKIERLEKREAVACMYVSGSHSFLLASGLISHNCDELRYVCMSRPSSGIRLSDITRPASLTECARDIAEATMSQGLRIPEDGLTRPQGAGGAGSWDDHIAGQNAYIAR